MVMFRTYTETYDLNTEASCPTLLGIHTPIGPNPYHFLYPMFMAYRKYKYIGCDVTVVNASHLPIDPSAFAIEGGTQNVDPRDMLNPILFKGCHGDSLGDVLDSMYGGLTTDIWKLTSLDKEKFATALQSFYYSALGDDAWRKSPIQKTLRINGLHPIVYQMATQMQVAPSNNLIPSGYPENGGTERTEPIGNDGQLASTVASNQQPFVITPGTFYDPSTGNRSWLNPQTMFTNKSSPLGWLDTQQIIGNKNTATNLFDASKIALLPKIFMGMLLLPPANKAYTYLRVIVRHKFAFREYRTITTGAGDPTFSPAVMYGYRNEYTGGVTAQAKSSFLSKPSPDVIYADEEEFDESE